MIHSRTLHALEFPQITEHLAGLCLSPAGRERALELRPLEDAVAVTYAARLYDESAVWAARPTGEGGFALGSFPDVGAFLRVAEKPGLQPDTDAFWALREMLRLARTSGRTCWPWPRRRRCPCSSRRPCCAASPMTA